MKLELQNYWKLLVDGPLYLTTAAEQATHAATQELSESQMILSNLDTAHALGLIESRAKRDRLQDQCATFDVVDAYTIAVDKWHATERPTTHRLNEMLSQIGEFLIGFSERAETPPPFLRGSLDWRRLDGIGVQRPILHIRELEKVDVNVASNSKELGFLSAHSFIFPASHYDISRASVQARIARLRGAHDKLINIRKDRKAQLKSQRRAIEDRVRADEHCAHQLERGEKTLETLDRRLDAVRVALAESAALGAYYAEVVRAATDARPVVGSQRIEIVEKQLNLARVQAQDLLSKRRKLHEKSEEIGARDKPRHRRERNKWADMRQVCRDRARVVTASIEQLKKATAPAGSQETEDEDGDRFVSFHETPDRELTKTQRLLKFKHASKKTHEEKLDDENSAAEDLMRQLKLATGSVDPSEITRRLRTSKQLNQSLRDGRVRIGESPQSLDSRRRAHEAVEDERGRRRERRRDDLLARRSRCGRDRAAPGRAPNHGVGLR